MKQQIIFVLIAFFAVAFVFGCGEKEVEDTGVGYTLSVNPTNVVASGVVTINMRLQNIFEKDMENTGAEISGFPRQFTVANSKINVGKIVAQQEYPVIWTMDTPNTDIKQSITPTVEVCFDYETEFIFDLAIKPRALAAETVQLQKGVSNGPVLVSTIGLDELYASITGSMNIQNNWQGTIKKFNSLEINSAQNGFIKNIIVQYSQCGGTTNSIKLTDANCDILSNKNAIGNGMTPIVKINLVDSLPTEKIEIERITGSVNYTYCYNVPVETITVCPAGQRC